MKLISLREILQTHHLTQHRLQMFSIFFTFIFPYAHTHTHACTQTHACTCTQTRTHTRPFLRPLHGTTVSYSRATNAHERIRTNKQTKKSPTMLRRELMDMTNVCDAEAVSRPPLFSSISFISSPAPLPPFLCRLEFISNQRASRELQLLITYSFAFLHINDCRVFGGAFLPQWFKGTSVAVLSGETRGVGGVGGGGLARGEAPRLANPSPHRRNPP